MKEAPPNEVLPNEPLRDELTCALARSLQFALGSPVDARRIRLAARVADASVYLPESPVPACESCPAVFGAPPFSRIESVDGWLRLTLSDALYDALVLRAKETLPPAQNAFDDPAVSRMLLLARHGGAGCPHSPAFRRALLLLLNAHRGKGAYGQASTALLRLFSDVPPQKRAVLTAQAGAYGDAAARLLLSAKRAPSEPIAETPGEPTDEPIETEE